MAGDEEVEYSEIDPEAQDAFDVVRELREQLADLARTSPWRAGPDKPTYELWAERAARRLETEVRPGVSARVVTAASWVRGDSLRDVMNRANAGLLAIERDILANPFDYSIVARNQEHARQVRAQQAAQTVRDRAESRRRWHEIRVAAAPKAVNVFGAVIVLILGYCLGTNRTEAPKPGLTPPAEPSGKTSAPAP